MIQKKICMIGSPAVGKTSLVRRYVEGVFTDEYLTTIGVKIDRKTLKHGGQDVNLILWDLAGDDAFQPLKTSYLRGMSGYLLVADGTRRSTLEHALQLQQRIEEAHVDVPFVVLLNKHDLLDEWDIDEEFVQALRGRGWDIIESSALVGFGVEEAFAQLTARMLTTAAA